MNSAIQTQYTHLKMLCLFQVNVRPELKYILPFVITNAPITILPDKGNGGVMNT